MYVGVAGITKGLVGVNNIRVIMCQLPVEENMCERYHTTREFI